MKRALGFLVGAWIILLGVSLGARCRLLPATLAAAALPASSRAGIESGDPAWHAFLNHVACHPGPVVVLAADASRESAMLAYRAAYERFPQPVRIVMVQRLPRMVGGTLEVDEGTARWVATHPATTVMDWSGTLVPVPGAWRVIGVEGSRVRVRPIPPRSEVPVVEDRRIWTARALIWPSWLLALLVLAWNAFLPARDPRRNRRPVVAGKALVALAIVLAILRAAGPQPGWSNWDAWAVWDLKVKAMRLEGWFPVGFLTNPDYAYAHQEYPLGWPWLVAGLSADGALLDTMAARLVSPLAALLLAAFLAALLEEVGVRRHRWLVAGAVALLPLALDQSSNGYVDWPLAAAMTGTMLLTVRACRGRSPAWMVGLAAGVAGNVKNEGLVGGLACLMALALNAREGRVAWRSVCTATTIWCFIAGPWQAVVWHLGLRHYDYGALTLASAAVMPHRLLMVVRALLLETFGAGITGATWLNHVVSSWLLFWPAATLVLLTGWRRLREPGLREIALILGVQVGAACGAYTLTVLDVNWLLGSSADRLLLQWVPAVATLAMAVAVRSGLVAQ